MLCSLSAKCLLPCFDSFSPVFRFGPSRSTDQSRSGHVGDNISHSLPHHSTDHHRYQNVVIEGHDPFAGFEEAIKNSEVISIRKVNIVKNHIYLTQSNQYTYLRVLSLYIDYRQAMLIFYNLNLNLKSMQVLDILSIND